MKRMKYAYPLYEGPRPYADFNVMLKGCAEEFSSRPALSYRENPSDKEAVRLSFTELYGEVADLATELLARGYAGKHAALIAPLSHDWVLLYYALLSIGAVLVPLDKDWTEADLADTVAKAECAHLFCDASSAAKARAVQAVGGLSPTVWLGEGCEGGETVSTLRAAGARRRAEGDDAYDRVTLDPDAMALLVFTSGTTGQGKGVMLTQTGIRRNIIDGMKMIRPPAGKTLGVLPPHHTYGSTIGILAQMMLGNELYLSAGIKYVPRELKQESPNYLILVPLYVETFYRRILTTVKEQGKEGKLRFGIALSNMLRRVGIDLRKRLFGEVLSAFGGRVSLMICGGAPLNREVADTFDALGITVLNGYGITECSPLIAANRNEASIPASVGFPLPSVDVRIDEPNEAGEGEILVKGPIVMLGYWKNEDATAEAIGKDGYFRTGDYGKLSPDGRLFITGRKKNLIILSNGKNVYPEEIEAEFTAVPGLIDIVVFEGESRRGPEHNAIVAEIYPDRDWLAANGVSDAADYFHGFVESYNRTAVPYKKIGLVRVRDEEFPKNTLRKIMRFKLDRTTE